MNATELKRRKFLLAATASVGGVGLVTAAVPFVESMEPSEAARAAGAPIEVDIRSLAPGVLKTFEWRGRPIWVLRRTEAMLADLRGHDALLQDPASAASQQPPYAANPTRSLRPALFVAIGICTHLGCVPVFRPEPGSPELGADWPGGFYCPCHGSKFDLAGRVFKNVPAPRNLEIPPYGFVGESRILIGSQNAND